MSDDPDAYARETLPEDELRAALRKPRGRATRPAPFNPPEVPGRAPKRPTHRLRVRDNQTGATATIGAGWLNDDGSVSVRLDPCCVVSYDNLKGKVLTLFPFEKEDT